MVVSYSLALSEASFTESCPMHLLTPRGLKQMRVEPLQEEVAGLEVQFEALMAVPDCATKTLYFVRHGEGFHNVAAKAVDRSKRYSLEDFNRQHFDAHLNAKGWAQAAELRAHLKETGIKPDLVVVSPLQRALETAVAVFGGEETDAAYYFGTEGVLMAAQQREPGVSEFHAPVSSSGAPPFVACELAREIMGVHMCDKRNNTNVYRRRFPGVDFSHVKNAKDMHWCESERETRAMVNARGRALMRWLMSRPEKKIAIVSHSTILQHTMLNFGNGHGHESDSPVEPGFKLMHARFSNCEMRAITVVDKKAANRTPASDSWQPSANI